MRRRFLTIMAGVLLYGALEASAEILPLDIAKASVTYKFPDQSTLNLDLTPAGSEAFAAFTEKHAGKTVDLKIEGKVMMSPRLVEPITGGKISISGKFAAGRLESIARKIAAGASIVDVETRD